MSATFSVCGGFEGEQVHNGLGQVGCSLYLQIQAILLHPKVISVQQPILKKQFHLFSNLVTMF